ncbi:hypothetical protein B6N60_01184 [Richelia sinica FACHB-800]|uniref:Uncharacterized protein n=1 Tax=Richelia sinica FACHB-800 TaxID=1357546 RepID=A0A975Y3U7_9NOST|nr:hypothetical protein [Richelia sinica]MBD2664272.1 hypothetical protein [Richelia sinica FACHB-800]QXE22501.1 hypothetical protein B6N60_01184 [Richelia sinica FACHB-800]
MPLICSGEVNHGKCIYKSFAESRVILHYFYGLGIWIGLVREQGTE